MRIRRLPAFAAILLSAMTVVAIANPQSAISESLRETTIAILKPMGVLVGDWKGVGQPKRGSNVGAWSEKAQAAWHFDEKLANLVVAFEPGQQFSKAMFSVSEDGKTPMLILEPLKGDPLTLTRIESEDEKPKEDGSWIFESSADKWPQTRCTIRIISEIRFTLLFEERPADKASFRRLAEIGLTRAGARLADGNSGERQCIVTGGLGTIKVSFEDKTYYVCCEGCKQAFDADPAGTIDAYRERLKEKSSKK